MDADDARDSLFVFLRAHDLLSLDNRRRQLAEDQILVQRAMAEYEITPLDVVVGYYEQFEIYHISQNAVFDDTKCSIFFCLYMIVAFWSDVRPSYLAEAALGQTLSL
ncbi:hypothetical protein [Paraburkholderia sp.]|uniref:hypothetical protein n=1 Tax=Paraburkholderia sp. TaxID=1926495 RepID=UPI003C7EBEC5